MHRLFAILSLISQPLWAAVWNIDTAHSAIVFKVKHMMVSTVPGKISGVTGTFDLDSKDLTKTKIDAKLDPNTIDTGNEKRDAHLKTSDFLETPKHPFITFKSKKVEKDGTHYSITGDLTLRGVTKEIVLRHAEFTDAIKDPSGNLRRGFSASTEINRKDFGVNWNKAMENGGVVVGDKVNIDVNIELIADAAGTNG